MRTIRKIHDAVQDDIGDLRTQRPLPSDEIDMIDPFLFLNHHGPQVYPPGNRGLPFGRIRIAGSRRSRSSSTEVSRTRTAEVMRARSRRAACSG